MKRQLLNASTALSLLVCVAVVALWVRSQWRHDLVLYHHVPRPDPAGADIVSLSAATRAGVCCATIRSVRRPFLESWDRLHWKSSAFGQVVERGPGTFESTTLGFAFGPHQVFFPLWLPALLFAAAPAARVYRYRQRRRRLASQRCPACGYDVRATPGRCPECGNTPAGATA